MWQFYLAGATVTFRHGGMGNYQFQYLRNRRAVPIARDYLFEEERALRAAPPVADAITKTPPQPVGAE